MFKNITAYRIAPHWTAHLPDIEAALQRTPFTPCAPTQEQSSGWTPPRGQAHGALAESVGGQWILRWSSEMRLLPHSVVNRHAEEKAAAIEREHGRKPGKKERQMLKDEARLDLLPLAFTKQSGLWVWIDPRERLLVLDTATPARADEVVSLLVQSLPGFAVSLIDTATSAQAAMAQWLVTQEPPAGFTIDRECELKATDESRSVVRYARHPLDIEEVRQHVTQGKLPTRLALTWDDRVSFVLTHTLQLKKVALLDSVLDHLDDNGGPEDDGFDTQVALATGELHQLLADLFTVLGGETPGSGHSGTTPTPALLPQSTAPAPGVTKPAAPPRRQPLTPPPGSTRGPITGPALAPADTAPGEAPF